MIQMFFFIAAALMLIDATGYSIGALRQLHRQVAPSDPYLSRRLLLNLMLANAGLYFTSLFAFAGAYLTWRSASAAHLVMGIALLACLYSVVTIPWLTPSDWRHTIPRALAAVSIAAGLVLSTRQSWL